MYLIYLILIVILFIYNITGIYLIIPLILAIANFILATLQLIRDNNNISRLIQLISLVFIIFIIILNINMLYDSLYKFAFIIPFSVNKITFLDDIIEDDQLSICFLRNVYISRFYFNDSNEIDDFLYNLKYGKSYLITFEFILS